LQNQFAVQEGRAQRLVDVNELVREMMLAAQRGEPLLISIRTELAEDLPKINGRP